MEIKLLNHTDKSGYLCYFRDDKMASVGILKNGVAMVLCDSCLDELLALEKPKPRYEVRTDATDSHWVRDTWSGRTITMAIEPDQARNICDLLNSMEAAK